MSLQKPARSATARLVNEPRAFEFARQQLNFKDNNSHPRLRYLVSRIHALGPGPLFHSSAKSRAAKTSGNASRIIPADLSGGDQFGPSLFAIVGRRQ